MGELIDDVIEYSSATRREPEYATLDLDRLAASVVARLTHAYPAARVDIGPLGTLYADPRMVEKILEALLGNALKFSARVQKPQVLIRADSAEGQTIVHVTDNGSGFDMAHTSHLFVLFRRLHHDHEFPGTGVGLATVRNLVERQGGTVSAHSAPGQGATFSFRLQTAAPPDSIQCAGVLGGTAGER
jgi:light-regulated signal transduction histidine kinase (bacteriophytochrome)